MLPSEVKQIKFEKEKQHKHFCVSVCIFLRERETEIRVRERERERVNECVRERERVRECEREREIEEYLNDRGSNYSINNGSSNLRDRVSITDSSEIPLQKNRDFLINYWNRKIRVK